MERSKKEEEKYARKRTKSVSLVTPRQEIQQQKDKLQVLMEKMPLNDLQRDIQQQISHKPKAGRARSRLDR